MRPTNDYQCESEEENEQQTSKKPDKKKLPKKQQKMIWKNLIIGLIKEKRT